MILPGWTSQPNIERNDDIDRQRRAWVKHWLIQSPAPEPHKFIPSTLPARQTPFQKVLCSISWSHSREDLSLKVSPKNLNSDDKGWGEGGCCQAGASAGGSLEPLSRVRAGARTGAGAGACAGARTGAVTEAGAKKIVTARKKSYTNDFNHTLNR